MGGGELIIRLQEHAGRITLNRPRALNALTLAMVQAMAKALRSWEGDRSVRLVIIDSGGGRAFCAGGDIGEVYRRVKSGDIEGAGRHCLAEYRLNALIARYRKPLVVLMDGIVMGGGIGISSHARHALATENTVLSMPECGIGFIPDAGATEILARAPGRIGEYLGLSGGRLVASDAIHAGFADALVPADDLPALITTLAESGDAARIGDFTAKPAAGGLAALQPSIDRVFALARVSEMIEALARNRDDSWSRRTLGRMRRGSPLSLVVALRAVRLARRRPGLARALKTEYRAAIRCMEQGDFPEGVRAAVIDRDRQPRWRFATPGEVPESLIDEFLAPLPGGDPEI